MRENNTTPLKNPEVFKKAISFLEELPPGMFADILESTKEAKSYQLLLQNAKIFQMAIPILEKLTDKQLVDILSKWDYSGLTLLGSINIFETAVPFLEKMPHPRLLDILSIKNRQNV